MGNKIFKNVAKFAVVLSLLSSPITALASSGSKDLKDLLGSYDSFSARFEQTTLGESDRMAQSTSGSLKLAKLGRFVWKTQAPYPQEIISDGKRVWLYDPDLEQVTIRALNGSQSSAPAMILNGDIDQLQSAYQIMLVGDINNIKTFELIPFEEGEFSIITLVFVGKLLTELLMVDSLEQQTHVLFRDQELNPKINLDTFTFVVPDGVDVFTE
ncbi:outer membrane lipoprotein chaperone LolA [Neptuniibacter sp. QD37_11]|uniref:outer membrane lipoprotein chaperone LolA n=1 Tax=Neptuniibacter sp. QD37_11 TaxID=3398209 RepID=UPI0039F4EEE8